VLEGKSPEDAKRIFLEIVTPNEESWTLETLINEEALLLAKYLRNETKTWTPRITV
jgi:hypothetical protein